MFFFFTLMSCCDAPNCSLVLQNSRIRTHKLFSFLMNSIWGLNIGRLEYKNAFYYKYMNLGLIINYVKLKYIPENML